MKRLHVAVAGLSLVSSALGCSSQGSAPVPQREQSPLVNSHLSSAKDNAVVYVLAGGAGCTGTLIAPNVVLTALHCLSQGYKSSIPFRCNPDGSLAPGSSGGVLGPLIDPPDSVQVRVGVQLPKTGIKAKALFGTGSNTACHDDIGLIVLQSAPDIGDAPLVPLRFQATKDREITRAVGYGSTFNTSTVNGRQARENIPIIGRGPSAVSGAGDRSLVSNTILIGEGPCQGDSGGPLLSQDTDAQVGVYSLILSDTCVGTDVQNAYTEVAPYEALIREVLATVDQEPIVEPPPATGTGGTGATGEGGEPGNAGAPNGAGAPGEGGALAETGGTTSTGGTTAKGGSGGSGAVGGTSTGGTGGTDASAGEGATPPPNQGKGSGSRDDGSCALQTGGAPDGGSRSLVAFALLALAFVRRRVR